MIQNVAAVIAAIAAIAIVIAIAIVVIVGDYCRCGGDAKDVVVLDDREVGIPN